MDTGASRSLIKWSVAEKIMELQERQIDLRQCCERLASLTGHPLPALGYVDLEIPNVGTVTFIAVQDLSRDCIIGIDQIDRHNGTITRDTITWGQLTLPRGPSVTPGRRPTTPADKHHGAHRPSLEAATSLRPPAALEEEFATTLTMCPSSVHEQRPRRHRTVPTDQPDRVHPPSAANRHDFEARRQHEGGDRREGDVEC